MAQQGKGEFQDMTVASGLGQNARMSGWGNGIADFDNDGWKDLFVARANVMDNIAEQNAGRRYPESNTIFRNLGQRKFRTSAPLPVRIFRRRRRIAAWPSATSTTTAASTWS